MEAKLLLPLIVAFGVVLRLLHVGWGLPDFNEEAIPFRRALDMWGFETGRIDLNPHFFDYPSLTLYLNWLLQVLHAGVGRLLGIYPRATDYGLACVVDPTPMVVAARGLGVIADALTILGCFRLGAQVSARTGLVAAAIVALSPIMILTGRAIYTDSIAAALIVWTAVFVMEFVQRGRWRDLTRACVTAGLATGAKYPSVLVLALIGVSLWLARDRLGPLRLAIATSIPVLTFVLSTPFAMLDYRQFVSDVLYEAGHVASGHFGGRGQADLWTPFETMLRGLGPAVLALIAGSLWTVTRRGPQERGERLLWVYQLPMLIALFSARISADRYFVSVIPIGAVLAAGTLERLLATRLLLPGPIRAAALAVVLAPVGILGIRAAASGGDDSQVRARRWCEAHIGERAVIIQEALGVHLRNAATLIREARVFASASPAWLVRLKSHRVFSIVTIPLVTSGDVTVSIPATEGQGRVVKLFEPGERMNGEFYRPRLFSGADYFVTSSGVRGRYERDPDSYPRQMAWYRLLDASATRMAEFRAEVGTNQPTLVVYRLSPALQTDLLHKNPPLSPVWWLDSSREAFRDTLMAVLRTQPPGSADAAHEPGSWRTSWSSALREVYSTRFGQFADQLAVEYAKNGRAHQARELAFATLLATPADVLAFRAYLVATAALAGYSAADSSARQLLSQLERRDPTAIKLRAEYDRWSDVIRRRQP